MKIYNRLELDINGNVLYEDSYEYKGLVAEMKGGGGGSTAGTISYPTFVEDAWKAYWGFSGATPDAPSVTTVDAVSAAISANPYTGETSFDPDAAYTPTASSPLDKMEDAWTALELKVLALDTQVDWSAMIDEAIAEVGTDFVENDAAVDTKIASVVATALTDTDTLIADAITAAATAMASSAISDDISAYELDRLPEHLRSLGRIAATYASMNSASSTGFVFATANAEARFAQDINRYGISLKKGILDLGVVQYVTAYIEKIRLHARAYIQNKINFDNLRANLVKSGIDQQVQLKVDENRQLNAVYTLKAEVERLVMVALKEKKDKQLEIDDADARWDIMMLGQGANQFGQLAGGVGGTQPPALSPVQSAIGGALSGAATGALAGSVIPGIGTAAGAIIGGTAGLLAGLF